MYLRTAIILAMFAAAGSAADLSIGSGVLAVNQPATLNVTLASANEALTGMQFDLEYDAESLEVRVEAGAAAVKAGKNLQSAVLQTGKQRILIVGLNRNTLADGVVAVLHVSLKTGGAGRELFPLRMTAQAGTNGRAEAVAISGHDGGVRVETRRNAK